MGVRIWSNLVTFLSTLNGTERLPIASAPGAPKQSTNIDTIANYINGNTSNFTSIVPVTLNNVVPNVYTGVPTPVQANINTTTLYQVKINYTNTLASTLQITTTTPSGALPIRKISNGTLVPLVASDLVAGVTYSFYTDLTYYILQTGKNTSLYDNNGNLLILGLDNVLNFPTTQSDMTFYVDPNGVDENKIKKNILSPYASAQQVNNYADNSLIYINAGLYTQTSGSVIFKNTIKYYLNPGTTFNQNGSVSMITASNNDTIYIRGYGKLTSNINYPIINITTPCNLDIELDEVYQSSGCTTPLILINSNGVTGRIVIKKASRDLSDTSNTSYLVDINGANVLDIQIDQLLVSQGSKAIAITNTENTGQSINFVSSYISGTCRFIVNGACVLNAIFKKIYANVSTAIVQASCNNLGALLINGKVRNFGSGVAIQLDASTNAILLQDVVAATSGAVSITNNASVTIAYGFVYGNGAISNPLTTGTYTQNINYQYI